MKINKIEMNGYTLYHIPNKKFKTFTIGAYFFIIKNIHQNKNLVII